MASIFGGWTETKDATPEIQVICEQVKAEVEKKAGNTYKEFIATKFRSQLVEGINYLIKIYVGSDYDHVQISEQLPVYGGKYTMTYVEKHHKRDDPLEPQARDLVHQ